MLKVIAYTGGPSGVFRVRQYIGLLRKADIEMKECRSAAGAFPPTRKWLRPAWGLWNVGEHAGGTVRSFAYDLAFFQRELLSTFVTWERFAKRPRIFDIDDAIWVHRRGDFARRLARLCDHVICGNGFLAQEFAQWNSSVSILPTPVDVASFRPLPSSRDFERPIIGWMGLAGNLRVLSGIEGALAQVLRCHPNAVLRVVSGQRPSLPSLPAQQIEFIPWTAENEARSIQEMTIGIMPLDDSVSSRGKCAYKMLLYMSCGLPVVVSPVGMNVEVLQRGNIGFGPANQDEWVECLDILLRNPDRRREMGLKGREVVIQHYSVESLAPELARVLNRTCGK